MKELEIAIGALKLIAIQDRRTEGEPGDPYYHPSELADYLVDFELAGAFSHCCVTAREALQKIGEEEI